MYCRCLYASAATTAILSETENMTTTRRQEEEMDRVLKALLQHVYGTQH